MHGYIPKDSSAGQNGDKKNANNYDVTVTTTQENSDTEIISMCIVPVKIRQWNIINKEVLTYASQGSFIQEDLTKEMQLLGRKATLNLKTLNVRELNQQC